MRFQKSTPILDEGTYVGELLKVVELETQHGAAIKFSFKILDEDAKNRYGDYPVISGMANANKLTTSTKLYKWMRTLNGGNLNPGDSVDPEDYIGRKVELVVRDSESGEYSNVSEIVKLVDPAPAEEAA